MQTSQRGGRAFSLVELLLAMSLLAVGLLALAPMFSSGYTDVSAGGRRTLAVAAARQFLEDVRTVPFQRLDDLRVVPVDGGLGFRTDTLGSLPPADATLNPGRNIVRDIARKLTYSLAGDLPAWGFTGPEKARWATLAVMQQTVSGTGTVQVDVLTPTLRRVTVTVRLPGQSSSVRLATLIARM